MSELREIDCRGLRCPLPIIRIAKELPTIEVGEELILLSDDPATKPDLAAWSRMRNQFSREIAEGRYLIRRMN